MTIDGHGPWVYILDLNVVHLQLGDSIPRYHLGFLDISDYDLTISLRFKTSSTQCVTSQAFRAWRRPDVPSESGSGQKLGPSDQAKKTKELVAD